MHEVRREVELQNADVGREHEAARLQELNILERQQGIISSGQGPPNQPQWCAKIISNKALLMPSLACGGNIGTAGWVSVKRWECYQSKKACKRIFSDSGCSQHQWNTVRSRPSRRLGTHRILWFMMLLLQARQGHHARTTRIGLSGGRRYTGQLCCHSRTSTRRRGLWLHVQKKFIPATQHRHN